jgi:hypothetical protein
MCRAQQPYVHCDRYPEAARLCCVSRLVLLAIDNAGGHRRRIVSCIAAHGGHERTGHYDCPRLVELGNVSGSDVLRNRLLVFRREGAADGRRLWTLDRSHHSATSGQPLTVAV